MAFNNCRKTQRQARIKENISNRDNEHERIVSEVENIEKSVKYYTSMMKNRLAEVALIKEEVKILRLTVRSFQSNGSHTENVTPDSDHE